MPDGIAKTYVPPADVTSTEFVAAGAWLFTSGILVGSDAYKVVVLYNASRTGNPPAFDPFPRRFPVNTPLVDIRALPLPVE
jgi:hypothetical protein